MKYAALFFLSLFASANVAADMRIDGMDAIGDWYLHVDFEEMRSTESGRKIYAWLEEEVFDDLREDAGLDIDRDVRHIVAQSDGPKDVIFVIEGVLRQEHKDQIMALAATQNVELKPRKASGREYFYMEGDGKGGDDRFDDGAYFSFDLKDRLVMTSSESTMQGLLAKGGRVDLRNKGSMFSLTAVNAMVGKDFPGAGDEWNSNIVKNTEEAAIVIRDSKGKIGVEAQLVSREAEMAESLASIVRGLISLQAFNEDIDKELSDILKTTKVDVRDRTLSIRLDLDADVVVDNL